MDMNGKVAVVTGGASGIGKAIAKEFANAGAKVAIADVSLERAKEAAGEISGLAIKVDVTREEDIKTAVYKVETELGPIDLFCSNAGVFFGETGNAASASNDAWQTCWDIHVMSHVYAARAVLPSMLERGDGYLLNMASAAGLLSQIGDAAYSATKHAAVGFAESLAISHGDDGIKVSVICPQYVATPMLGYEDGTNDIRNEGTLTSEEVAKTILKGVEEERFLILTHKEVRDYVQHKAADTERWIEGMQKLRQKIIAATGGTTTQHMRKLV